MKRHPALQDLSRDHFHVLFRCQRFRRLLAKPSVPDLLPLVDEFLAFFQTDMSPHFDEEDQIVVPAALRHAAVKQVATRTRDEHRVLRARIEELQKARPVEAACRRILAELEPMITAHVEMEEHELFEGLQRAAPESEMAEVGRRSLEFRRRHRAPDTIGPRKGRG